MRRIVDHAFLLVSLASSLCTIVLAWSNWAGKTSPDGRMGILVLSSFALALLVLSVLQEFRHARKSRYAETLSYLNQIVVDIQHASIPGTQNPEEIRQVCRHVVNTLAAAFSLVTSTRCSVCIKVLEADLDARPLRPKVTTLCRDDASMADRTPDHSVNHWVDQNTDFEQLHVGAGTPRRYFFSNRLSGVRGYKNTSFDLYGKPWDVGPPVFCDILRDVLWPLPYRSTMVVPISPGPSATGRRSSLAGYLCVDSRSRGAFRRRFDLDLITGVATCLFAMVHRYCEVAAGAGE